MNGMNVDLNKILPDSETATVVIMFLCCWPNLPLNVCKCGSAGLIETNIGSVNRTTVMGPSKCYVTLFSGNWTPTHPT